MPPPTKYLTTLSEDAPLHNWRLILRTGWGDELARNVYGYAVSTVLMNTRSIGLCGMVAPDGSDVWDRKKQPGG